MPGGTRIAFLAIVLAPSVAEAGRYGVQTALADGLADAVLGVGLAIEVPPLAIGGAIGVLAATPVVHGLHGNRLTGLMSFVLRMSVLAAGGFSLLFTVPAEPEKRDTLVKAILIVMALGIMTLQTIDALVFAEEGYRT